MTVEKWYRQLSVAMGIASLRLALPCATLPCQVTEEEEGGVINRRSGTGSYRPRWGQHPYGRHCCVPLSPAQQRRGWTAIIFDAMYYGSDEDGKLHHTEMMIKLMMTKLVLKFRIHLPGGGADRIVSPSSRQEQWEKCRF